MRQFNRLSFFVCILFGLFVQFSYAKSLDIKYFDAVSEVLTGTIMKLTFPGPPNYEDVNKGDISETCPYLMLDHPVNITVKAPDSCEFCTDEKNVQLIQLAVSKKSQWRLMNEGARVKVEGMLYEAHTAHHHTRVLMLVGNVRLEKSKAPSFVKNTRIQCGSDHGFCEVSMTR